ncbi:HAD hydrolase-like protein, partial [Dietzia kunjamensis]
TAAADLVGSTRPLVIGDRLDTDIQGAVAAGMPSLMVLTGVHGVADLLVADPDSRATYLADDLSALSASAEASRIDAAVELDGTVENGALHLTSAPEALDRLDLARAVVRLAWRHESKAFRAADEGLRSRLAGAGLGVG